MRWAVRIGDLTHQVNSHGITVRMYARLLTMSQALEESVHPGWVHHCSHSAMPSQTLPKPARALDSGCAASSSLQRCRRPVQDAMDYLESLSQSMRC